MKAIKNIFYNFKKYSFLMSQLVIRDFKVKYKRSFLGILWSLLYPLLVMAVMAVVFSQMFRFNVPGVNYLVYLLTGVIMFQFINEGSTNAMNSIIGNGSLIRKVYIPKYIFPLTKVLFTGVNFLLTLIPLVIIVLVTGEGETNTTLNMYYLVLPFIFICMFLFVFGIGLILATLSVFLRDVIYIYGVVVTMWQFLTPIFYDVSMLPQTLQFLMNFNPSYVFITSAREIILFGQVPSLQLMLSSAAFGIGFLILGSMVFKLNQNKFIYYV